jgi:antitoxin component YwqK of YwqJK toxin-antitoxin module
MGKLKFINLLIIFFYYFSYSDFTYDTLFQQNDTLIKIRELRNGILIGEHFRRKGKTHGLSREWYLNGKLKSIGKYSNGSLADTLFSYFEDGSLESKSAPCGKSFILDNNKDTVYIGYVCNKITKGLRRMYYSANQPERFTNFNDQGKKHGWEVYWYKNGKVKDSTYYHSGTITKGKSFYLNGQVSLVEDSINGRSTLRSTSYTFKGKKSGEIKNGTGTVLVCDSLGNNCNKLIFKNGNRVME